MNREEIMSLVRDARAEGKTPNLNDADLSGMNLWGVDLSEVSLRGADLTNAYLSDADLSHANLRGANLHDANLSDANLMYADLTGTDLSDANLGGANLSDANLSDANLRRAGLTDANLSDADWYGLRIDGLPSHQLTLTPTPDGWDFHVGCWHGTPDKLRELIAQDDDWPEAKGAEVTRRRPYLQAALALCEVHMKDQADYIGYLKERWGTND